MAIAITATLVGVTTPRMVQVEVTGLTISDEVTITGVIGSHTWTVRGADSLLVTSEQLIRSDNLAPVNVPITYRATVNGTDYDATEVTVPYTYNHLLSTLGLELTASLMWIANGGDVTYGRQQHLTNVPGRATPVVRYAASGGESGSWEFAASSAAESAAIVAMLRAGVPLVMRTNASVRDFPPQRIVAVTGASSRLFGTIGDQRIFTLNWTEVADPLASTPVAGATFADINAVLEAQSGGGTFADWNALMTGLGGTFADFNRVDWATEAA